MTWWNDRVRTLFVMELRSLLRDRRTIVMSIVLPLLLMPAILFSSRYMEERRQRQVEARQATYAVLGPRANEARPVLARALKAQPAPDTSTAMPTALHARERRVDDPARALADGTLDFYVEAQNLAAAREAAIARDPARHHTSTRKARDNSQAVHVPGEPAGDKPPGALDKTVAPGSAPAPNRRPGAPPPKKDEFDTGEEGVREPPTLLALSIVFRADRDDSREPARRMADRLRQVRRDQRYAVLTASGFPAPPTDMAAVEARNLAGAAQVAGLNLGRFLTLVLMFLLLSGGSVVAQDALAGEKERGTLETLLTTAMSRGEIIAGKVALVLAVALGITIVQVLNLLVYVGFGVVKGSQDLSAAITPGLAAGLLVFVLPLAALVAGVLVLVSGHAKTYREAQLYFLPIVLLGAVPALAASLPEIALRSAIVLVPVANISVGVKEMLVGRHDWLMLPLAWLVTAGAAAYAMSAAARALSTERLIVPSAADMGVGKAGEVRLSQVAMWFVVMWALVLVTSLNLGEGTDIRVQLLVNLVVVFFGGSVLFIRRFRLNAREVLSLRMPHPLAWLAVLLGTPCALVTGLGVFKLSQVFLPVPREMLESFSQYLVPDTIPFWQLLPLMTILPGICEEIAFRGVLLHSLRRYYVPWVAALGVGIAFGLFHFSLFRIVPTAYLGVILATVTILARSIYPAMAWHALNNGLGLLAGHYKVDLTSLRLSVYVAAAGGLALAIVLLVIAERRHGSLRSTT